MGGLNEVLELHSKLRCSNVEEGSRIPGVVSGTKAARVIEYVDHLHEHFIEPCVIRNAAYIPPKLPGFSIEMKPDSIAEYEWRP